MLRKLAASLVGLGLCLMLPLFARAGTEPCPAIGVNPAGACNIVITIAPNGSIATTAGTATEPYDTAIYPKAADDVTVGVINNSSSTITSLTLTGMATADDHGPFSFDEYASGDGVCDPLLGLATGSVALPCSVGQTTYHAYPFGPTGYESSANVQFSNYSSWTTGTVNFLNGILGPGDSTWFGLEAPAGLNLQVQPTPTPEPSSVLLLATGVGLLGLAVNCRWLRLA